MTQLGTFGLYKPTSMSEDDNFHYYPGWDYKEQVQSLTN